MTQLKENLKVHTDKPDELNKQLSEMKHKETAKSQLLEMKKQKQNTESKCWDLEATIADFI